MAHVVKVEYESAESCFRLYPMSAPSQLARNAATNTTSCFIAT